MAAWLSEGVIREVAGGIAPYVLRTPTLKWPVPALCSELDCELFVKLELMQRTGSFKARGAINTLQKMRRSGASALPGVTAFSAGNHAIATAYAAAMLDTQAKVVMPRSANAFRVERCRAYGAEIVFGETIADLMAIVERLQTQEGLALIHPFEGEGTVQGTATVGLELCEDVGELDAVIVPVGGGGLISGVAAAVKALQPGCRVIGVEPGGASGMSDSLAQGNPLASVSVQTIADSLGAPMHLPRTYELVQRHVDQMVTVSDDALRDGMRQLFADLKLAVEPACAAALAALKGPLAGQLSGQRVALIACGSNIDLQTWSEHVAASTP